MAKVDTSYFPILMGGNMSEENNRFLRNREREMGEKHTLGLQLHIE